MVRSALTALASFATLGACQAEPVANDTSSSIAPGASLSDEEQNAIKLNLLTRLSRQEIRSISGSFKAMCAYVFELGEPEIVDSFLGDRTGKVRIKVPVTARNPLDAVRHGDPASFPSGNQCYGTVPGGWTQNQTASAVYEINLEKWNSGWREVDRRGAPLLAP